MEEIVEVEELEPIDNPVFDYYDLPSKTARLGTPKSKKIKVIFLDIDGVLNYKSWRDHQLNYSMKNIEPVDPQKVKLISKIIKKTKAKVVFSSSWRFIMKPDNPQYNNKKSRVYKVKRLFNKYNIKIADVTGCDFVSPDKKLFGRGCEIQTYLDNHPEIYNYAIIDDAAAELQNFIDSPHMFLTSYEDEGITEKQCDEIIGFLNEEKKCHN